MWVGGRGNPCKEIRPDRLRHTQRHTLHIKCRGSLGVLWDMRWLSGLSFEAVPLSASVIRVMCCDCGLCVDCSVCCGLLIGDVRYACGRWGSRFPCAHQRYWWSHLAVLVSLLHTHAVCGMCVKLILLHFTAWIQEGKIEYLLWSTTRSVPDTTHQSHTKCLS